MKKKGKDGNYLKKGKIEGNLSEIVLNYIKEKSHKSIKQGNEGKYLI